MDSEGRQQFELLPLSDSDIPHVEPVTPALIAQIRRRRSFVAAWNYAQDFACLADKQCYDPVGIDSSHWSKIRSGKASPPGDERLGRYFDVVGNEIPLIWLAESRGYDWTTIRKHVTSEQRRIAELESENRDLRRSMNLWVEAQKCRP